MSDITLYTEPKVYLVGQQSVFQSGLLQFQLDHEIDSWRTDTVHDGEKLSEVAGRLCYMSFANPRPGGNKAYIEHILEVGHGSVLEHATFNFIFTQISRACSHELVRHRAGMSYSQLSQRYVDESDVGFIVPPAMLGDFHEYISSCNNGIEPGYESDPEWYLRHLRVRQWISHMESSLYEYKECADWKEAQSTDPDKTRRRKQAREFARSVLPNCTETKIFVTGNARAWRHFIELRADPAADKEIRRLAVAVLRVLQQESPNLFGDYAIEDEAASTAFKKV